jgi:hypothetical protein
MIAGEIIKEQKNPSNSFLWVIPVEEFMEKQVGEPITSYVFLAAGYAWTLYLYPNGTDESSKGRCCIQLRKEDGMEMKVKYKTYIQKVNAEEAVLGEFESMINAETPYSSGKLNLLYDDVVNPNLGYVNEGIIFFKTTFDYIKVVKLVEIRV